MRKVFLLVAVLGFCASGVCQSTASDESLLTQTRALYDAPFTRGLVSFDCAVKFDWKQHFIDLLGTVPPTAVPVIEKLQTIEHRVFVDRSGATVSAIPKAPDLSTIAHASELEQGYTMIVAGGLNTWLPFSTNVILPIPPTKYNFQKTGSGFTVTMSGDNVEATILLDSAMHMTSISSQLPHLIRSTTEFSDGPDGYLLKTLKMSTAPETNTTAQNTFAYTFQDIQGVQLPASISVTTAIPESWRFSLSDCKATIGKVINVAPPR
jgi:hypothetical protein